MQCYPHTMTDPERADGLTRAAGLLMLLTWYFASARSQAKLVKERFGSDYTRRRWGRPIGIALLGATAFVATVFMLAVVAASLP